MPGSVQKHPSGQQGGAGGSSLGQQGAAGSVACAASGAQSSGQATAKAMVQRLTTRAIMRC